MHSSFSLFVISRFLSLCRPRLSGTMFQKDLGSLLDKSSRVEQLVPALGEAAGLAGVLAEGRGWVSHKRAGPARLVPRGSLGGSYLRWRLLT